MTGVWIFLGFWFVVGVLLTAVSIGHIFGQRHARRGWRLPPPKRPRSRK
jgi:hypothetical protein